jgi:pyruvate dehydrogenase E2 component (dihydrolipoamide acetyltransferase)
MLDFTMPRYGFMQRGTVSRWFKKEGDPVRRGEMIVQVESDKVVNDVECPADGFLKKILVPEGQEQDVFESIALIAESRQELEQALAEQPGAGAEGRSPAQELRSAEPSAAARSESSGAAKASPVARKMAREHNVELATIAGTGPGGRITEKDVQQHLKARISEELSPTRKALALHLTQGLQRSALVTQSLLCRCDSLLAVKEGAGVSVTAVLVKLLGELLGEFPHFNAHLIGEKLVTHTEAHIGVAVHTESGLLVPVVRNVRQATLASIQEQLKSLAARARERALSRAELQGSTFTLSNLGMFKTDIFTPILNFPEVGILGVGRIFRDVQVDASDATSIVNKVWLSLSFDHRALDGVQAAQFLGRLEELLGDEGKLRQAVREVAS